MIVNRLEKWLSLRAPWQVISIGAVLVVFLGVIDHVTGYELSFSVFYLTPIVIVTWYSRQWYGYVFCVISAAVWLAVEFGAGYIYSSWMIPFWNAAVRLGFFVIISFLLGRLKIHLRLIAVLARTDGLTQILNSNAFRELASRSLQLAKRYHRSSALGYIDLDNFKQVNDLSGHTEGDRVLQMVASTLTKCVRDTDIVGRLGGDEFTVFLPETGISAAREVFGKIYRELINVAAAHGWTVGFSIGVAVFSQAPATVNEALNKADRLMYRVKSGGKNNVIYEEYTE